MDWKANILTTDDQVRELLSETQRIAVLGIKPESHATQPAFYVPKYMAEKGYKHAADILAKKPKSVWFQLGITNDELAEKFARAGIKVVQDLCLMVEHRTLMRSPV